MVVLRVAISVLWFLKNWVMKKTNMTNSIDGLRLDLQAILDALQVVCDNCKEDGWDGYDAYCISSKTFKNASDLVRALPVGIPAPEFTPDPYGDVVFGWRLDDKNNISVRIGYDSMLYYDALIRSTAFSGGLKLSGKWPVSVIDIVKSLFE